MPAEDLRGLHLLPEWAALVKIGHVLRDTEDGAVPESQMELILTVLRLIVRLLMLRWSGQRGQHPVIQDESDYAPAIPYPEEPEPFDPPHPAA